VHGGLHPEYGMQTPKEIATLIRYHEQRPWYESYTGTKPIIYGHWAAEWLRIRSNTIGIDTGCCFGWALTAYCLESGEIWQVRANAVYKEPAHWKGKSDE
jgi:bis(5'-nucleosyl)-tetraphosphatase (symmetrical)